MYIKPGPNYKMSGTAKRMLATIVDPHQRGVIRRSVVQAELAAAIVPKSKKDSRDQK